ncbi:MAG: hypothetical protein ACPLZH_03080, partial [Minisyncoccales bacterium]
CFCLFIVLIYALPAFQGNFISPIVKIKIPPEYFSLFAWSKNQDKERILILPIHDPFGWIYYLWNLPEPKKTQIYQGAGFNWFGLNQPSLNSEFNRWYPYNEQAYREFFYAVYSQNQTLFQKLLAKYNIKYILLDENVIVPGENNQSKKLFYPEIKELLAKIENIKLIKKFGNKISIFEYLPNKEKEPIEILTNYKIVEPAYRWNYVDEAYFKNGDYVTPTTQIYSLKQPISTLSKEQSNNLIIYPGRNILTEQEKINQKILSIKKNIYEIIIPANLFLQNGEVKIPSLSQTESEFYVEIYAKKNNDKAAFEFKYLLPYLATNNIYVKEFIIKNKHEKLFSLNDRVFFLPDNLSQDPIYLGETILSTQKENFLNFYKENPKDLSPSSSLDLFPYLCSEPHENQIFGAEKLIDNLKIYGQAAKICLDLPLNKIVEIEKDGVLEISFDYRSQTTGENEFCFFDQSKNRCLFTKNIKPSLLPKIDFFVPIEHQKSNFYFFKFSFDTRKENQIKELLAKNFNFKFYEKNSEEIFVPEIPPFE